MKIVPAAINIEQSMKIYSAAEKQPIAKEADIQDSAKSTFAKQPNMNLTSTGTAELTSYKEIAALVEKIIFSSDFKEININQNTELKAAYEEFINSLNVSGSELKEYISQYASEKTKFSEELLAKLSDIINNISPDSKVAALDFLKALDSYFTRKSDLDGLLSVYIGMSEGFTSNTRDLLMDLLYASDGKNLEKLIEKITVLLTTGAATNDAKKLEVIFNTVLNKLGMLFEYLDKSDSLLTSKANTLVQEAAQTLRNVDKSGLPDYMSKKIDALLAKCDNCAVISNKTFATMNADKQNSTMTNMINSIKFSFFSSAADTSTLRKMADSIANKILTSIKNNALIDGSLGTDKTTEYLSKLSDEIACASSSLDLAGIIKNRLFPAIENYIPDESQNLIEELSHIMSKLLDAEIRNRIYGGDADTQISKEATADIMERSILPRLLSSGNQEVRSLTSFLTHSLMRIKNGSEQSVLEKADELFDKLASLPLKDLIDLKYELAKMINKYTGSIDTRLQALSKLLTQGMEHSSNSANARVFENILMSLLAKSSVDNPYRYTFLPFCYNEIYVISEIWVSDKNDEDKREKSKKRRSKNESEALKIFIPFEIENEGYFESLIVTSEDLVYLEILLPEKYKEHSDTIKDGMKEILEKHNLLPGMVSITTVPGPRSADEVFSSPIPNGEGVMT